MLKIKEANFDTNIKKYSEVIKERDNKLFGN
jgi:hypothetical protein